MRMVASSSPSQSLSSAVSPLPRERVWLNHRWLPDLAACLLLAAVGYFLLVYRVADRGLWSGHEGRAAQIAQRMLDEGWWTIPTLYHGHRDYEKPPLFYWLVAVSAWLRGGQVDAWSVRLPAVAAA